MNRAIVFGLALGVIGCKKHNETFGRYDDLLPFILATCNPVDVHGNLTSDMTASTGTLQCSLQLSVEEQTPDGLRFRTAECPCTATATVHRAANWNDVDKVDVSVVHCPHAALVVSTFAFLEHLIAKGDRHAVEQDLDNLGHDAMPMYLTAVHRYGDVTLSTTWSRDAYQGTDGRPAIQTSESIYVSLSPRRDSDSDQTEPSNDPRVVSRPRCN